MQTNLYVIVSKSEFDAVWKNRADGVTISLDGTRVLFDAKFTGAEIKQLVNENKDIYNMDEAPEAINNSEWQKPAPIRIEVDEKFKSDYAKSANKFGFLETKLGLK